jgi:cobalt/nickel transport system permease protein
MHIDDGVLVPEVWLGGFAVASVAVGLAVRRFHEDRVPEVAVLTSIFFVASLIEVPLGGTSVHLLLNGLVGIILGWLSFPSVLVALFFQKILLGHGGFTTLGVNTVTLGSGALASHILFFLLWRKGASKRLCAALAFVSTLAGVFVSGGVLFLVMCLGGEALSKVAAVSLAPQLVVSLLDGLVTSSAVVFLLQVKPEMLSPQVALSLSRRRGRLAGTMPGAPAVTVPILGALMILSPQRAALAHNLEASARLEQGEVVVEAAYAKSSPAWGARVRVWEASGERGENGRLVAQGMTDERGRFSFRPERLAGLLVVVEDRAGHRAVVDIAPEKLESRILPEGSDQKLPGGEALASSSRGGLSGFGPEWLRVLLGLAGIGAVSWLGWRILRRRGSRSRSPAQGSRAP